MTIPGIAAGFTDQGATRPDNLIAGEYPRVSRLVTITGGVALPVGAVLGRISADGRYRIGTLEAEDGTQTPDAILAEAVDTTAGDRQAVVYFTGEFNELALSLGTGHTLDSVREAFRDRSLFLRKNQPV